MAAGKRDHDWPADKFFRPPDSVEDVRISSGWHMVRFDG
jgi:hypothetical protein